MKGGVIFYVCRSSSMSMGGRSSLVRFMSILFSKALRLSRLKACIGSNMRKLRGLMGREGCGGSLVCPIQ